MSLINDALKKAARQRADEQADLTSLMPGGGGSRASRHGGPMRKQTMILIGAAAVALVVVSVVVTGAFVTARPETKQTAFVPAPAATKPAAASVAIQAPALVAVTMPRIPSPVPTATPAPTQAPLVLAQPIRTQAPAIVIAPVADPVASAAAARESVQAYVDGLHVTGARSAGTDSKALVDGHVFRLNDILDKALGLKLTRVEPDRLTFVDAAGDTFVKSY